MSGVNKHRDGGALGRLNFERQRHGLPKLGKDGKPIKTKGSKAKTKAKASPKKPKIAEGGLKGRQNWFQSRFG